MINAILQIIEDGRFVAVYDEDQIITLNCPLPPELDLAAFATPQELFLAGVAFARLGGADRARPKIQTVESEEL